MRKLALSALNPNAKTPKVTSSRTCPISQRISWISISRMSICPKRGTSRRRICLGLRSWGRISRRRGIPRLSEASISGSRRTIASRVFLTLQALTNRCNSNRLRMYLSSESSKLPAPRRVTPRFKPQRSDPKALAQNRNCSQFVSGSDMSHLR